MSTKTKDTPPIAEDCDEELNEIIQEQPGIVGVRVDPNEAKITFDYLPDSISPDEVATVAQRLQPSLDKRIETCTMRLQRRGGRSCESCAVALENRVKNLNGVHLATASYVGGSLKVEYDREFTSSEEILEHIQNFRVPVKVITDDEPDTPQTLGEKINAWLDNERTELIFMIITLAALVGGWIAEQVGATDLTVWAIYAAAYVAGGTYGLRAGLESLMDKTIDVDLLMILAAIGAALVNAPFEGAMLLFLFSLSNVLQNYALDRTRNAIRSLMKLRPTEALTRRNGETVTLSIEDIRVGDEIIVRPGERIPLDGAVIEGESSVDQAPITGESIPVAKTIGSEVFAGTINQAGGLEVRVTKLAKDSTIAKLIQLVEEAHSEKAKTQRFIDTAEQYYALGVIVFTALAIVVPQLFLGEDFNTSFYRAMTLMVAASPCALVISTPATVLSAIGNGAKKGILFKGGVYLEDLANIKVVAFDKTGTLTIGKPQLTDIHSLGSSEDELLALAAAVEAKSEHPLAQAVLREAEKRGLPIANVSDFQSQTGKGVSGTVNGKQILIGSPRSFRDMPEYDLSLAKDTLNHYQTQGKTAILVADEHNILGVIAIADVLRPNVQDTLKSLKAKGIEHVVMLTGDNYQVAQAIGAQAGVDEVHAELLPEDKLDLIKTLEKRYGPVAMIGDGVNDAPALAAASIGMAMGAAGTDVALETADVVLMADDLNNIPYAIGLSHATRKTLIQNLVFAFGVILVLVGAVLGFSIALPLSVIGHEGSTVLVSLNGLRLLGYKE